MEENGKTRREGQAGSVEESFQSRSCSWKGGGDPTEGTVLAVRLVFTVKTGYVLEVGQPWVAVLFNLK